MVSDVYVELAETRKIALSYLEQIEQQEKRIAELRSALVGVLQAASAIAQEEDCDWHHEDLEKAVEVLGDK